jgi:hypothetical protein
MSKISIGVSRKPSNSRLSRLGSLISSRKGSGETNYHSIVSNSEFFDDNMDEDGDVFFD